MATRRKKAPRSASTVKLPPWGFATFTDLHVCEETLDRAMVVLERVGEVALEHNLKILCLGDFWDLRGALQVRHIEAVQSRFDKWLADGLEAVIIPGNHDQVSQSGLVHGVRLFEAYPNITVATEAIHWPERQIAFLPWREDPVEQSRLFEAVPEGWTIFAHAEAPGAIANSGKTMPGRYGTKRSFRAIYLGHFHKRQKLGDSTWYIGSPFEMNMGERGEPHGMAIIREASIEPEWIDWDDFPKHHRMIFGEQWDPAYVRPEDIVEVHAAPTELGTEEFAKAVAQLGANDVRALPLKNGKGAEAPQFAMSLEQGVETIVDENAEGLDIDERVVLKTLGRELLRESGADAIVPMSPFVSIKAVHIEDFCAVRGVLDFELPLGAALIRGPMGIGKTAIMDAITWCLFGATTPRKAGSHGASLRADEVINDEAPSCEVVVSVELQDGTRADIRRAKKRGSGAKVEISGVETGISDYQQQINHILGIDHDLWRTCVYLGQGAVGNFVTDADRRRKDLLSSAFGLQACPAAQTAARKRWKQLGVSVERLRIETASGARVIETLQATDFTQQIAEWEEAKTQELESIRRVGEEAKEAIEKCVPYIVAEEDWLKSKAQHEAHIQKLTKDLANAGPQAKAVELQRKLGGYQAERAIVVRDLSKARAELAQHNAGPGTCPTCGQPFDDRAKQQHVEDLERRVTSLQSEIQSFDVRISNTQMELENAGSSGNAHREGLQAEIAESRAALKKCEEGLNMLTRIKANKSNAEFRLHDARERYAKVEQKINPFLAKQAEQAEQIKTLSAKLRADEAELEKVQREQGRYSFWDQAFGPKGIPVLVLRTALHELETYANQFMARMLHGRVFCRLDMQGDDLKILFYERSPWTGQIEERRYEQLSGGQRRCVELAFNPFALSEMIFNRCGVRLSLLVVDELTTHLGQEEKPIVCDILRQIERDSVLVIDHDLTVQGSFDHVIDVSRGEQSLCLEVVS